MSRYTISILVTVLIAFAGFNTNVYAADPCSLSLTEAHASTTNISISFNASAACDGTVYVYVTNYDTDMELVFTAINHDIGPNSDNYSYSMAVTDGATIGLNVYHTGGTGGFANATWSGAASSGSSITEVNGGGACDRDVDRCNGGGITSRAGNNNSSSNGDTAQFWDASNNTVAAPQFGKSEKE